MIPRGSRPKPTGNGLALIKPAAIQIQISTQPSPQSLKGCAEANSEADTSDSVSEICRAASLRGATNLRSTSCISIAPITVIRLMIASGLPATRMGTAMARVFVRYSPSAAAYPCDLVSCNMRFNRLLVSRNCLPGASIFNRWVKSLSCTCIAVFITSGIAESKVWETGWEAMRLGIAAFLIPFAFVFNQGLLLQSDVGHVVLATLTAAAGAVLLACGIRGYALDHLNAAQRVLFMAAGLLFIAPGWPPPLVGLAVVLIAYSMRFLSPRTSEKS